MISITRLVSFRARHAIAYLLVVVGLAGAVNAQAGVSISGSPATSDVVGTAYKFTPTATDTKRRTLSFRISNKPTWASFSTATGTLSGTPASANVGTTSDIMITVTDGRWSASLAPFSITVTGTAPAPTTGSATISWSPPTTNSDGSALTNLAGYKIDYGTSSASLTTSVQITNSGATSYTVPNLTSGTWYFAVQAYTNSGVQSGMSNIASKTIP